MQKAIWVGKVASLARDIEVSQIHLEKLGLNKGRYDVEDQTDTSTINGSEYDHLLKRLGSSSRFKVNEILGEWENEPEEERAEVRPVLSPGEGKIMLVLAHSILRRCDLLRNDLQERVNIRDIIQFRQSLSCLNSSVPFSAAFGHVRNRADCCTCSEEVYNRLMLGSPGADVLSFEVIAHLSADKNGDLNEQQTRELIHLFRPDRDGNITLLDFAKSIDAVYKELRLLRASVANSSKVCAGLMGNHTCLTSSCTTS